jgi:hypothetical protein
MSSAGTLARERFESRIATIAVGATLARRKRPWTVTKQTHRATTVDLTLRHGRHTITVPVPVCHTGPVLWQVRLHAITAAPMQRELLPTAPT